MGIENIANKIKKSSAEDDVLRRMLLEIFQLQLEEPSKWKAQYKEIITKYTQEAMEQDED